MESHYEINVALNGSHLFATATRSLKTLERAKALAKIFKIKFPESEGYDVSMTHYDCVGRGIKI